MTRVRNLCAQSDNPRSTWLNLRFILRELNDAGADIKPRPGERWTKRTLCERLSEHLGLSPRELEIFATLPEDTLRDVSEWETNAWDAIDQRVIRNAHRMRSLDNSRDFIFEGSPENVRYYNSHGIATDRTPINRGSIRPDPLAQKLIDAYALEAFGMPASEELAQQTTEQEFQSARDDLARWVQTPLTQRERAEYPLYDHQWLILDFTGLDFTDFSEQNFPSFQYIKEYLLQEAGRHASGAGRRARGILIPWPNTHTGRDHNDSIVWFAYVNDDNSGVLVEQMRLSEAQGARYYPQQGRPTERVPTNRTVREVYRKGLIVDREGEPFIPIV